MTSREFRLPDLGEGLTESDVVTWHVAVGDAVELNQVIAEVETAKALVEIPSPCAGTVAALHAEEGQTVGVGEPLVTFEVADDVESVGAEPTLVGYGAAPERGGHPVRRPRRYATAPGPAASTLLPAEVTPLAAVTPETRARSSPGVRAFARRLGVDLAGVTGSGQDGRVTRQDVEAAGSATRQDVEAARSATRRNVEIARSATQPDVEAARSATQQDVAAAHAAATAPEPEGETRTPVRGVRKHTAAAMVTSAFTAPQASVMLTVDATASMELIDRLRAHPRARGERITVLALVARAVCTLLGSHPALGSRWEELPDGSAQIVQPAHVNLGIAVATDRGLVVPNIPAADTLPLPELAAALTRLTRTAREGRTPPERLTGGTFTITNIGVFGVDAGTPILNPGESGILGLGAVRRLPWEHDGQIALRQVVTLSLTFDHRVVDGEQAARFLADLGAVLGDPALAVLLGTDRAPRWLSSSKPPSDQGVVSTSSTTENAGIVTAGGAA